MFFQSFPGYRSTNRDSATHSLSSHPIIWLIVCFHDDWYKATGFTWLLCYILNQSIFLQGTGRIYVRSLAAVKEYSCITSTRSHQLTRAEKAAQKPREQSPQRNTGDLFRLKLPNAVCAILIEVSHSSDTHRAPTWSIMNLSRLRTFDIESVTDQITTLSYF